MDQQTDWKSFGNGSMQELQITFQKKMKIEIKIEIKIDIERKIERGGEEGKTSNTKQVIQRNTNG